MKYIESGKQGLIGAGMLIAIMSLICAILGLLVKNELLNTDAVVIITRAVLFAVTYICCTVIIKKLPQGKLVASMLVSVLYIIIAVLCTWIAWPGYDNRIGWSILLPITASVLSGIVGSRNKKKKR